ncbi:myb-like protein X isoform X2 [Pseudophryne corroboree]|uniref:myb-like protein X isoform X2 n=1 Tax=Pseudophryne corroboree TaxID=495146 RepID=UPI00308143FF
MFSWIEKAIPQPPGTPTHEGQDAGPATPILASSKCAQNVTCPGEEKDRPTGSGSASDKSTGGVLGWLAQGLGKVVPQPMESPTLQRTSKDSTEPVVEQKRQLVSETVEKRTENGATEQTDSGPALGVLSWLSQGLEKVVPQPSWSQRKMSEPSAVVVEQKAQVEEKTEKIQEVNIPPASPVHVVHSPVPAPVAATPPAAVEVLPVATSEAETGAPDRGPGVGVLNWLKQGLEKVVPQPETPAVIPIKLEEENPKEEVQPPAVTGKDSKSRVLSWITSNLEKVIPQPVTAAKQESQDVSQVEEICILPPTEEQETLIVEDLEEPSSQAAPAEQTSGGRCSYQAPEKLSRGSKKTESVEEGGWSSWISSPTEGQQVTNEFMETNLEQGAKEEQQIICEITGQRPPDDPMEGCDSELDMPEHQRNFQIGSGRNVSNEHLKTCERENEWELHREEGTPEEVGETYEEFGKMNEEVGETNEELRERIEVREVGERIKEEEGQKMSNVQATEYDEKVTFTVEEAEVPCFGEKTMGGNTRHWDQETQSDPESEINTYPIIHAGQKRAQHSMGENLQDDMGQTQTQVKKEELERQPEEQSQLDAEKREEGEINTQRENPPTQLTEEPEDQGTQCVEPDKLQIQNEEEMSQIGEESKIIHPAHMTQHELDVVAQIQLKPYEYSDNLVEEEKVCQQLPNVIQHAAEELKTPLAGDIVTHLADDTHRQVKTDGMTQNEDHDLRPSNEEVRSSVQVGTGLQQQDMTKCHLTGELPIQEDIAIPGDIQTPSVEPLPPHGTHGQNPPNEDLIHHLSSHLLLQMELGTNEVTNQIQSSVELDPQQEGRKLQTEERQTQTEDTICHPEEQTQTSYDGEVMVQTEERQTQTTPPMEKEVQQEEIDRQHEYSEERAQMENDELDRQHEYLEGRSQMGNDEQDRQHEYPEGRAQMENDEQDRQHEYLEEGTQMENDELDRQHEYLEEGTQMENDEQNRQHEYLEEGTQMENDELDRQHEYPEGRTQMENDEQDRQHEYPEGRAQMENDEQDRQHEYPEERAQMDNDDLIHEDEGGKVTEQDGQIKRTCEEKLVHGGEETEIKAQPDEELGQENHGQRIHQSRVVSSDLSYVSSIYKAEQEIILDTAPPHRIEELQERKALEELEDKSLVTEEMETHLEAEALMEATTDEDGTCLTIPSSFLNLEGHEERKGAEKEVLESENERLSWILEEDEDEDESELQMSCYHSESEDDTKLTHQVTLECPPDVLDTSVLAPAVPVEEASSPCIEVLEQAAAILSYEKTGSRSSALLAL